MGHTDGTMNSTVRGWFSFCILAAGAVLCVPNAGAENWPGWRGPRGDGSSLEKNIPIHWGAESNILWKVELPGTGHASPVVWENRIFIATANEPAQERLLLCLDRDSGQTLWKQTVLSAPLEKKNSLNSFASGTPVTDGKKVYAAFLDKGEMFVAAYDMDGKLQWAVRPGPFASMHGFCTSPLLYKDLVIVNGDHDGNSYLAALSREDGHTVWKTPRENHTRSYCTALIRQIAGRNQMILTGDKCTASYDPQDGRRYWVMDGPTEQFVASPVYNEKTGLVLITGGYPDHHILAIKPDGTNNVTKTHIAWRTTKGVSYVPSPISVEDFFLVVSDRGQATCFEAATGTILWQESLGQEEHASLVSANGLVYFLNDNGEMTVVKPGREFNVVARNTLPETFFASPALSQGRIFLRGNKHLYCIGER
jgi:outer membrane protein assembly factor BamB